MRLYYCSAMPACNKYEGTRNAQTYRNQRGRKHFQWTPPIQHIKALHNFRIFAEIIHVLDFRIFIRILLRRITLQAKQNSTQFSRISSFESDQWTLTRILAKVERTREFAANMGKKSCRYSFQIKNLFCHWKQYAFSRRSLLGYVHLFLCHCERKQQ